MVSLLNLVNYLGFKVLFSFNLVLSTSVDIINAIIGAIVSAIIKAIAGVTAGGLYNYCCKLLII
jgi:multisubunit Na+/H+ antiporter MnhE subunit